ncbi:MAG: peptidylprolyl isomerase [Thermoanaerobaculia bacterium]
MSRDESTHRRSFLRQPLFQFLVLGLMLFGLYVVFGEKQEAESKEIVISSQQIELLASMWEKQWRRPPTPQELNGLIQSFIREEVLYREALAMGLDRDDMVVRRRLAQKIEFLAQDLATQGEPGDAELRTFYQENAEQFEVPAAVTFTHVYLNLDQRGEDVFDDADRTLAELKAGADATRLGDRFMLQSHYANLTQQGVARNFGNSFAEDIFELAPGTWEGPVQSGYGLHLVQIENREEAFMPPFEEVRPRVRDEFMSNRRREVDELFFERLRESYEIVIEEPTAPPGDEATGVPSADP